ncbi:MAG TPA: hypothetical protein PKC42_04430 [Candidatus Nanoperiomorbaceae bacterium]|nr:hypothetical protein [Candidatus Nanoperiomorbaceae bacterium]
MFDYVFVRAAEFFFKRDGIRADRAVWTVVAIQGFMTLNICVTLFYFLDRSSLAQQVPLAISIWGAFLVGLYVFNNRRYNGQFYSLQKTVVESVKQRRWNGALIVIIVLLLAYYPFFLLTLFNTHSPR